MLFPLYSGSDNKISTRTTGMFITWMCQWLFSQTRMNNYMINVELCTTMLIYKVIILTLQVGWWDFNFNKCVIPYHMLLGCVLVCSMKKHATSVNDFVFCCLWLKAIEKNLFKFGITHYKHQRIQLSFVTISKISIVEATLWKKDTKN